MLHTAADAAADRSPAALEAAYAALLASTLETVGRDRVAAETDLDGETLAAIADGDVAGVTLAEAAAVLATDEEYPDPEAVVFETRDHLLMGMTTAVLDVDTLAAATPLEYSGQEIQQAIEGRTALSLGALAAIQSTIDRRVAGDD
jgi:hypothetical protein